jgi:hypothetical protein
VNAKRINVTKRNRYASLRQHFLHQNLHGQMIIMNMTLRRMPTAGRPTKLWKTKHRNILLICQSALLLLLALALMGKTVLRCMEIYAHSVKNNACILIVLMKVVCMSSYARKTTDFLRP